MLRRPGDPDYITVHYDGAVPGKGARPFLTKKFNEVAEIFAKHGASVSADSISVENHSAPGSVPEGKFDALAADLKPRGFSIVPKMLA